MVNRILFTGAGFSKSINPQYPLLADLTKKVTANFEKEILGQYYKKEISDTMKHNLEYLLTYLSADLPWKSEKTKAMHKALYIEITERIHNYFQKLEMDINSKTDFNQYKDFANFIINNKITTITLNYDLMLENILKANDATLNNVRYFYNGIITNIEDRYNPGKEYSTNNGQIKGYIKETRTLNLNTIPETPKDNYPVVLKLHGSINWIYDPSTPSNPIYYIDDCNNLNSNNYGLIPYIISPVLDKNRFYANNILKGFWQNAHEVIKKADEIYIIGFSFPTTDLTLKYLFQSALRNKHNTKVYVINYDSEHNTQSTYKNIFTKEQLSCNNSTNDWKFLGKDGFNKFLDEYVTQSSSITI